MVPFYSIASVKAISCNTVPEAVSQHHIHELYLHVELLHPMGCNNSSSLHVGVRV